jgi:hypothetical protein
VSFTPAGINDNRPEVTHWTCSRCKSFVLNGSIHNCPNYNYPLTTQTPIYTDHGFRYAAALEWIAAALERLAKRLEEEKQ